VSHKIRINTFGRGHPAHDLPIAAVQCKRDTNTLTIVARQFEAVRTPARVTGLNSHDTVMTARVHRANPVPVKQPTVIAHHAIHPLVIDAVAPALNAMMAQNGPNTTIAVGGLFTN